MADFGGIFDSLLEKYKNAGQLSQVDTVEQFLPQIKQLAEGIEKSLGDGFQWTDVVDLVKLAKPLMLLVKSVGGLTGEQKKAFVKESIWLAYKTYDGGESGTENKIDIPFLFGGFERKVEEIVVPMLAEVAVEALYPELKASGALDA